MRRALPVAFLVLLAWTAVPAGDLPAEAVASATSLDDCDGLVVRYPDELAAYQCYWGVARQRNLWADAARRLEARLAVEPDNPMAMLYLAPIRGETGDPAGSEKLYRAAAEGLEKRGHVRGEGYARISLAMMQFADNRVDEAFAELDRVDEIAGEAGDEELQAMVLSQRAHHATRIPDYVRAWSYYKEMERLVFPDGTVQLKSWALSGLGYVSWATGRFREGLEYFRREAEMYAELGRPYQEVRARVNIVELLSRPGRDVGVPRAEVEQAARDCLEIAVATGNRVAEAKARLLLAIESRGDDSLVHATRGLAIARSLDWAVLVARGLLTVSDVALTFDPPRGELAREHAEEALELARDHADLTNSALALATLGRIHLGTGSREEALPCLLEALDTVERMREMQLETQVRSRFFSKWRFVYTSAIGALLEPGLGTVGPEQIDRAYGLSERWRARTLLEELSDAGAIDALASDDPLHEEHAETVRRIVEVQRRLLHEEMDRSTRDSVLHHLARLEEHEFTVRTRIADADHTFAFLHRPTLPSVNDIRARLEPDQALLSFWTTWPHPHLSSTSWVMVLTSEDERVYRVPDLSELGTRVDTYLGLLRRDDGLERYASARLYDDLLRDALGGLTPDVTRLIVIPDTALVRLPFGALRASPDSEAISAGYDVTLTPSAATWLRLKDIPRRDDRHPILALADPSIDPATFGGGTRQSVSWAEKFRLARLPGTRDEARSVTRRLGGKTTLWTGAGASERRLKQADLRDYSVVLLATHTVIDDDHPDRTAVFLSPGHEDEDGLLQAREIADLDLDGQTIVLSGCSSATGEFLAGEGVLGIARSFFVAGAGAVVGSLWAQEDTEAAMLIEAFSKYLARGMSVAAALAAAQRDLQRDGAPVVAWAGMVVLGDGDLVPFPGGRAVSVPWAWTAVPTAALLLLFMVARRSWRTRIRHFLSRTSKK